MSYTEVHDASGSAPQAVKKPATWPALLTLLWIAPILGEVFSWSTPPLRFIFVPTTIFYLLSLYGLGAIFIREIVRRRKLGWGNILLLGCAYGVFEEGMYVQSWFNPNWPGLSAFAAYERFFNTNIVWAAGITAFHMVFSITIPILLTEAIFPNIAEKSWMGKKGLIFSGILFIVVGVFSIIMYGFVLYSKKGYTHPPLIPFLLAVALVIMFGWAGTVIRFPAFPSLPHTPPRLWTLRIAGFTITLLYFLAVYIVIGKVHNAYIPILLMIGLVCYSVVQSMRWARRAGWDARHRLALASGAFGFWIAVSPVAYATGVPVVAVVFLALLIWLAKKTSNYSAGKARNSYSNTP